MSYRSFIAEFQQLGLAETMYIGEGELLNELNKLIKKRGIASNFNQEIHKELWEQCSTNSQDQVLLSQYVKTMVDAKDILEDRLQQTEGNTLIHTAKLTTSMEERKAIDRELAIARSSGEDRRVSELSDRLQRLDAAIQDADIDYKDFDFDLKCLLMPFAKDELSHRQSAIA